MVGYSDLEEAFHSALMINFIIRRLAQYPTFSVMGPYFLLAFMNEN